MTNNFLKEIMSNTCGNTLTICGSMRNASLMQKYEAYYTIKNNVVLSPVNYFTIKHEVEFYKSDKLKNKNTLEYIHNLKIKISDAIIVIIGEDNYIDNTVTNQIKTAKELDVKILFNKIPTEDKDKYYFNHDSTYPLYILKED